MKTLKWSFLIVLVTSLGVSTITFLTRLPRPLATEVNEETNANEPNQEVAQTEPVVDQPAPMAPAPVRKPASVVALTPDKTDAPTADIASAPANTMRVRADQVLAKVNDQAILLADLVPLQPDEQEQAMTLEEYESRLNRAIETELTFQAAAARGVDLTPAQKERMEGIVQKHQAALQEYQKQSVTWSTVTAAHLEFEQRMTSALMLQQNLIVAGTQIAPGSDPAVQARYEQARRELLSRLKGQANIIVSTATL